MNHQYMIALNEYSEAGSLTNKMSYVYKDNPVDFAHACDAFREAKQTYVDEDGVERETAMKKYKVTPQILTYATIEDMEEFKRVNHIVI